MKNEYILEEKEVQRLESLKKPTFKNKIALAKHYYALSCKNKNRSCGKKAFELLKDLYENKKYVYPDKKIFGEITGLLANCYYYGIGTKKDDITPVRLYVNSAFLGFANAQTHLGYLYLYGGVLRQDIDRAIFCFRKAADQGNMIATEALADIYFYRDYNRVDIEKSYKYVEILLNNNIYSRLCILGTMYLLGEHFEKDEKKALEIFENGYENYNSVPCAYNLADLYEHGKVVEKDLEKAKELYDFCAKNGNQYAKAKLNSLKAGANND